jgi:hypothetical protein
MDHVVYLDGKEKELERVLSGAKTMIIRGAAGRKIPHGRVSRGDVLYFVESGTDGSVRGRAEVSSAFHSDKLTPQSSAAQVEEHQDELLLSPAQFQRWAGKRYLVLVGLSDAAPVEPFAIDKSAFGNMDDWLPVGDILSVRA